MHYCVNLKNNVDLTRVFNQCINERHAKYTPNIHIDLNTNNVYKSKGILYRCNDGIRARIGSLYNRNLIPRHTTSLQLMVFLDAAERGWIEIDLIRPNYKNHVKLVLPSSVIRLALQSLAIFPSKHKLILFSFLQMDSHFTTKTTDGRL